MGRLGNNPSSRGYAIPTYATTSLTARETFGGTSKAGLGRHIGMGPFTYSAIMNGSGGHKASFLAGNSFPAAFRAGQLLDIKYPISDTNQLARIGTGTTGGMTRTPADGVNTKQREEMQTRVDKWNKVWPAMPQRDTPNGCCKTIPHLNQDDDHTNITSNQQLYGSEGGLSSEGSWTPSQISTDYFKLIYGNDFKSIAIFYGNTINDNDVTFLYIQDPNLDNKLRNNYVKNKFGLPHIQATKDNLPDLLEKYQLFSPIFYAFDPPFNQNNPNPQLKPPVFPDNNPITVAINQYDPYAPNQYYLDHSNYLDIVSNSEIQNRKLWETKSYLGYKYNDDTYYEVANQNGVGFALAWWYYSAIGSGISTIVNKPLVAANKIHALYLFYLRDQYFNYDPKNKLTEDKFNESFTRLTNATLNYLHLDVDASNNFVLKTAYQNQFFIFNETLVKWLKNTVKKAFPKKYPDKITLIHAVVEFLIHPEIFSNNSSNYNKDDNWQSIYLNSIMINFYGLIDNDLSDISNPQTSLYDGVIMMVQSNGFGGFTNEIVTENSPLVVTHPPPFYNFYNTYTKNSSTTINSSQTTGWNGLWDNKIKPTLLVKDQQTGNYKYALPQGSDLNTNALNVPLQPPQPPPPAPSSSSPAEGFSFVN